MSNARRSQPSSLSTRARTTAALRATLSVPTFRHDGCLLDKSSGEGCIRYASIIIFSDTNTSHAVDETNACQGSPTPSTRRTTATPKRREKASRPFLPSTTKKKTQAFCSWPNAPPRRHRTNRIKGAPIHLNTHSERTNFADAITARIKGTPMAPWHRWELTPNSFRTHEFRGPHSPPLVPPARRLCHRHHHPRTPRVSRPSA